MSEKTPEQLAAEEAEKKKSGKIEFNDEQTAFINKLFDRTWAEASSKKEKELQDQIAAEKAEREKLAAEKAELEKKLAEVAAAGQKKDETPQGEQKPTEIKLEEHPMFKQLQARFEEMTGIFKGVKEERDTLKAQTEKDRAERRKSRKKDQFLNALTEAQIDFFDPMLVYKIASEEEGLEYDEENDRVFVKNAATGQPRLNSNMEPMTAVDFVKEFAARKKFLVKSKESGGLGQGETEKLPAKTAGAEKDWSKATPEELEAERQRILSKPRN